MKNLIGDGVAGAVIYVVLGWAFDRLGVSWAALVDFCVVIFFAYGPDVDFAWLYWTRLQDQRAKRPVRYGSHWFIHFPVAYGVGGLIIIGLVCLALGRYLFDLAFYLSAFVLATLVHFWHDSQGPEGVQWPWPFSQTAYRIEGWRFVAVDPVYRKQFYERLRLDAEKEKRTLWDEIMLRTFRRRPWMDRK